MKQEKKKPMKLLMAMIIISGFYFACCGVRAAGVLRAHPTNPRYFTDGSGKAIYLTGSHTWGNLVDYPANEWPAFDWNKYLDFMQQNNHNFIRLWTGDVLGRTPSRYVLKENGKKVDLNQLSEEYFDRLEQRVGLARQQGIYVGVMLFRPDDGAKIEDWPANYFNVANNINGINGDTNNDGRGAEAYNLSVHAITDIQKIYVTKVIDTLKEFDNVIFEIGNEGDFSSIQWQYYMIDFIKDQEKNNLYKHSVGMTAVFDILGGTWHTNNEALFNSPADWISPGLDPYKNNPPVADGRKIIIADVDHIWPATSPKSSWIWQAFFRGINPILMDWYTYGDPSWTSVAEQQQMRKAMGQTNEFAKKVDLANMIPQNSLSSTTYCLADQGNEYLVYQPEKNIFSLDLARREFEYEWYDIETGQLTSAGNIVAEGGRYNFSPSSAPAVLYLKKKESSYRLEDYVNITLKWLENIAGSVDLNIDGKINVRDLGRVMSAWEQEK